MTDQRTAELYASWRGLADRGEPIEIGYSRTRGRLEVGAGTAVLCLSVWAAVALTPGAGLFGLAAAVLAGTGWRRLHVTEPAVVISPAGVWTSALAVLVPWGVIGEARTAGNPSVVLMVDKDWARGNLGHLSSLRRYAIETGRHELAALPLPRHLAVPDFELGVWITARAQEGGLS
ncbi:hypothetical protein [Nocardioides sp.]|uniref:hypothetical protein n=1 Tax=Nocardioides sp. TaxID=35761 RepID=UPI001A1A3A18|nr:hypothetical protein [Nocardioides sp.]MBJ7356456.1 hypothetical protein [Nocardioides sp.]